MLTGHKIGIIIYIVLIMFSLIVMTAIHSKAKKSSILNYVTACQISVVIWLFFAVIENLFRDTPLYPFVVKKVIIIIYYYGPIWLLFTLEYIKKPGSKSNKWRWLIFLPAVATTLLTLINPDSLLIISDFDGMNGVQEWGIVFLLNALLAYIYVLISSLLIMLSTVRKKRMLKENILLVLSTVIPMIMSVLFYSEIIHPPLFNMMPVSLSIFIAVSAILVFRSKLFDVLPFAIHEVFISINEAVLIIDMDGTIIDFNPACRKLFAPNFEVQACRDLSDLSNNLFENISNQSDIRKTKDALENINQNTIVEFQISMPNEPKYLTCSVYPFRNSSQRKIGYFLTFFDSTEYRKKTLKNERVRLSNDLHDSIGNSLNIISSNLEYALSHQQCEEEIYDCLQKSYDRSISLFLDLRRIVEELSPVDIEKNGLIWALETMFNKLRNKGINIEFENCMTENALLNTYPYGEYIYFVCQEAINNAITHGRARNINIVFNQSVEKLKIYISDDGVGCDIIIKNKGIKSMQLRVDSLGGSMEYGSPSDGGFNIKITLPINSQTPKFEEKDND